MGKRGPKPESQEILAARGSWRARAREKAAERAKRIIEQNPEGAAPLWKPLTKKQLDAIIMLLPGYDPHKGSAGCWFDYKAANEAIRFFETKLKHVEGAVAGKFFILERWQKAVVANLFGWKRKDASGRTVRRYREAFIYVPRKNGKTPLAAGICLYVLFEDREPGAQIVSAASERDQAALLFRHARGMVEQNLDLSARAHVFKATGQRSIQLNADPASAYRVISADAGTKHGFNLHLGVVDELHTQPNRDLVDTLVTATASENRAQPLMVYITTADYVRESICNEKYEEACKVRDGILDNASILPVIYELPKDADWKNPENFAAANPNLGVSVSNEYLIKEAKRAAEIPAYENTFKRLHLNIQTEQDIRFLPMDAWNACGAEALPPEQLKDQECYVGVDLASREDITAAVFVFPPAAEGDFWECLPFFWVPRENAELRSRRDRVPYTKWIADGHMFATEGSSVDYAYIRKFFNDAARQYDIRQMVFDPWNARQLITELSQDGFKVYEMPQTMGHYTSPTKELLRLLAERQIRHPNNPVLNWMASNAAAEQDPAGNIKPSKKASTQKIDGIAALVMGIRAAEEREGRSVYETREAVVL